MNTTFCASALSSLPDAQLLAATPLTGGLTNRCWKLALYHPSSASQAQYVWRPLTAAAQAFGVNRQHEYQLLHTIAGSGLAPVPYALLDHGDEQVLVVEWLDGKQADAQFTDMQLCRLQADIHHLPLPSQRLDVTQRIQHYWHAIPCGLKTADVCTLHAYFSQLVVPQHFSDTCCHFDLGRYNIIVPTKHDMPINVIDWEYAAAGDPSLDLTMTIMVNDLDLDDAIAHYCQARTDQDPSGNYDVKVWHQAVVGWQPWCQYLALLWYLVGFHVWQEEDYRQHAEQLIIALNARLYQ